MDTVHKLHNTSFRYPYLKEINGSRLLGITMSLQSVVVRSVSPIFWAWPLMMFFQFTMTFQLSPQAIVGL